MNLDKTAFSLGPALSIDTELESSDNKSSIADVLMLPGSKQELSMTVEEKCK